ncbi:MAG: hypothetical protein U5O69_06440 [Candidatus Competibacteraceae bacterium]|nr:hypothetical protein [Candidatus Competibacteraceae bacterium]
MMRMWQGAVGVAPVDGMVSPAYVVVRPYIGTDTSYFNCYSVRRLTNMVNKYSRRISCQPYDRLYLGRFRANVVHRSIAYERSKIAAFLRSQDHQIAKLIRGKCRLIELLNEQKQIIIHRAVTRGLNPDVPLKPSGIDWLGDVPAHWEVCPLKAIGNIQFMGNTNTVMTTNCRSGYATTPMFTRTTSSQMI